MPKKSWHIFRFYMVSYCIKWDKTSCHCFVLISTSFKPCPGSLDQSYISRNLKYKIGQDFLESISKLMSPINYDNFRMDVLEELYDLDLLHEVQPERNPNTHRVRIQPRNALLNPNIIHNSCNSLFISALIWNYCLSL